MEQNKQTPNGPKMNMPRFNMNWIYFLAIATLIFAWYNNSDSGIQQMPNIETTYTDFQGYMERGYADKLVVDKGQGKVRMYVKAENYRDVFMKGVDQMGKDAYLSVDYGSIDKL